MTKQETRNKAFRRNQAENLEIHAGMGEKELVWFWHRVGKGLILVWGQSRADWKQVERDCNSKDKPEP